MITADAGAFAPPKADKPRGIAAFLGQRG
jgi:hypothetical protein